MTLDSEFWLFKLQAQYSSIKIILLATCIYAYIDNSMLVIFSLTMTLDFLYIIKTFSPQRFPGLEKHGIWL